MSHLSKTNATQLFLGLHGAGEVETLQEGLAYFEAVGMPVLNLSARSRQEYHNDLSDLIKFLNERWIFKLKEVGLRHLENYQAEIDHRGYKASTCNRKTHAIKSFFKFMHRHNIIPTNVAGRLIPPPANRREPRFLSQGEYQHLRQACQDHPQDAAIIELLLQTGMLLSELTGLTIFDVDIPEQITSDTNTTGVIRVTRKKGGIEALPLNHKACSALAEWLKVRPDVGHDSLFVTTFNTPMSKRTIQYTVDKYLEKAGIKDASVQTLRHTMATHYLAKGGDLQMVHRMLGNESLKTTRIYADLAKKMRLEAMPELAL